MTPGELLSTVVAEVEVRTTVAALPPFRVRDLVDGPPGPLLPIIKALRPTVEFRGANGEPLWTLAPFGVAPRTVIGVAVTGGLVLALVAVGFVLGRASK